MITKDKLYEAKKMCNELKASEKVILKGKNNILLTTSIYLGNNLDKNKSGELFEKEYTNITLLNLDFYNYLDAYLYLLHQNSGANVIINYLNHHLNYLDISDLELHNLYKDKMIKNFVNDNNIDFLCHFINGGRTGSDDVNIFESISSFSCLGLTGISKDLEPRLNEKKINYYFEFGGKPTIEEFRKYGYKFTDDTILFNKFILNREILVGDRLDRNVMWPRTLRIAFSSRDTILDKRIELFNLIEEYLEYVKKELSEKGPYDALEPMQKRKIITP